jgi:hypothetical protein
MYDTGQGVPQDYSAAAKWYRLAAEQGDADGQFNTGLMHEIGQGVPQDFNAAVKWYRLAAEQGNASAQLNLGLLYLHGQGVPMDYVLAHMWANIALDHATDTDVQQKSNKLHSLSASLMTPQQIVQAGEQSKKCVAQKLKGCQADLLLLHN